MPEEVKKCIRKIYDDLKSKSKTYGELKGEIEQYLHYVAFEDGLWAAIAKRELEGLLSEEIGSILLNKMQQEYLNCGGAPGPKTPIPVPCPKKRNYRDGRRVEGETIVGNKKTYPNMISEQMEVDKEISEKVLNVVMQEYEMSAMDFIHVMEYTKNAGLRRIR